jgi:hypothetical protein
LPEEEAMTVWDEYHARWRPSHGWASTLYPAVEIIGRDPSSKEAVGAWCEIAMMLGDTHAAPLALIVCLYAEAVAPPQADLQRLHAHRDMCLLELGLGRARRSTGLRIAELGTPELAVVYGEALELWLAEQLEPFDGDLAAAAQSVLALALARVEA